MDTGIFDLRFTIYDGRAESEGWSATRQGAKPANLRTFHELHGCRHQPAHPSVTESQRGLASGVVIQGRKWKWMGKYSFHWRYK